MLVLLKRTNFLKEQVLTLCNTISDSDSLLPLTNLSDLSQNCQGIHKLLKLSEYRHKRPTTYIVLLRKNRVKYSRSYPYPR